MVTLFMRVRMTMPRVQDQVMSTVLCVQAQRNESNISMLRAAKEAPGNYAPGTSTSFATVPRVQLVILLMRQPWVLNPG